MIEIIVLALICILSFILILRKFEFSVYILMILSVLLHKELFSFYRWDFLPVRAFMFALLAALGVKAIVWFFKDRDFPKLFSRLKDPIIVSLLLLWVIRFISLANSKNLEASFLLLGFFTTVVALFIFVYSTFKNKPDTILKYLKFYTYLAFALTVFGYFQFFLYEKTGKIIGALWNIPGNIPRVGSTFWDVNHYGSYLASVLPFLGVLILFEKGVKNRILNILMFLSISGALLLTSSRSAWIMAAVSVVFFVIILFYKRFGTKGILSVLAGLVLISAPFLVMYNTQGSAFRNSVKQYLNYRIDSSDSHMLLLTGAYEVFMKYPIIGGGYGSFFEQFSSTEVAATYFGRDPAALTTRVPPHTIWGELISETGVLGLATFASFSFFGLMALYFGVMKLKEMKDVFISAAFFATIIGWYFAGIFYSYNSEFFWIILSLFFTWSAGKILPLVNFSQMFGLFVRSNKTIVAVLTLIASFLIFIHLGQTHLIPWDEAIYAKISKNMIQTNNYLLEQWVPGVIWYEKPPLYMWLASGTMKLFGFTSWGARLPSALFGLLTVLLVYLFGKKLFNKTTGFLAAIVLVTTTQFLYYSRASMTDVTAGFFISAALVVYYLAKKSSKLWLWLLSGLFIGLGGMTKGVVGLLPFTVIFTYELYLFYTKQQKFSWGLITRWFTLFVVTAIVVIPWHYYMYLHYGNKFLSTYIGYHVWDRAIASIEDKGKPFYWYFVVLKVSMRIWFIALLGALPFGLIKSFKKNNNYAFVSIWFLIIFAFFSVAKSKLVWYIIPAYPAAALLVGIFIERILDFGMKRFKVLNNFKFKVLFVFLITSFALGYLFYKRELVYTEDLTSAQATLLQEKDLDFGTDTKVYIDRMEMPLALFYTDGPFQIIDFNPEKPDRVPPIPANEPLILLTKTTRYSDTVVGIDYAPRVIKQKGDWILWYFDSKDVHQAQIETSTTR